jgi:hypothetical protein
LASGIPFAFVPSGFFCKKQGGSILSGSIALERKARFGLTFRHEPKKGVSFLRRRIFCGGWPRNPGGLAKKQKAQKQRPKL